MSEICKATITLHFTGELRIDGEPLLALLRLQGNEPTLATACNGVSVKGPAKLAYSMQETADLLGVSYVTVHRLLKRGLLKSCRVLRHKVIPKTEIDRFLKETTRRE